MSSLKEFLEDFKQALYELVDFEDLYLEDEDIDLGYINDKQELNYTRTLTNKK